VKFPIMLLLPPMLDWRAALAAALAADRAAYLP